MEEITFFIKNAITEDNCLGRCLYIHGVPGTGKVLDLSLKFLFRVLKFAEDSCLCAFRL